MEMVWNQIEVVATVKPLNATELSTLKWWMFYMTVISINFFPHKILSESCR